MQTAKKLLKIFSPPIIVLSSHIILIPIGAYTFYPWLDIPMHFLGGLSVYLTYSMLFEWMKKKGEVGKMNELIFFLFMISLVVLTAVLWEFMEFILDRMTASYTQLGLADTIGDLFLGIIGGVFAYFIIKIKNKNSHKSL
ncbi:MAG: hypothetical protein AABY05_00090 [Nanoarchaeota archaeon]